MDLQLTDSLQKIFYDDAAELPVLERASMFRNEKFSFCAVVGFEGRPRQTLPVKIEIVSPLGGYFTIKHVGHVPSKLPAYENPDDDYIRLKPGLYPDVLKSMEGDMAALRAEYRETFWLMTHGELPAGLHRVLVRLTSASQTAEASFMLEVLNADLPPQGLIYTQWLHCDCIAQYHNVGMFDEKFWDILGRYVKMAADYGMNMLLTPVFTPPLDTAVGGQRMAVQLVDVSFRNGVYSFRFDRLGRWIDLANSCGIKYFEISHMFTQWGAEHAPQIMAHTDTGYRKIFGWETGALSREYVAFLSSFIPSLVAFLKGKGLQGRCWFHVSDEPRGEQLENYKKAAGLLMRYIEDFPVMDALSDYEIFEQSPISEPVVAISCLERFLGKGIPALWGYYCCSQNREVSNRFFSMPSSRNRVLGMQLYRYDLKGFLHWGYNFYNTQYSLKQINPYEVTDAGGAFPSGDAFSVYPEGNGCTESLRLVVFHEGLQDYRALKLFENLTNRDFVCEWMKKTLNGDITFKKYPKGSSALISFRQKLNDEINKKLLEKS